MGTTLGAITAALLAEWRALDAASLQFWQRDAAQLALLGLGALTATALLIRAALARRPGRHRLAMPALLRDPGRASLA